MPQLIVRNLELAVVRRLRNRAADEGISVEEAHRRVLRQALLGDRTPANGNFVDYLQAMPDVDLAPERVRELPRAIHL